MCVCARASVRPTGGAAVQLYEHCVCSISFERLVRSGDDFLSAAAFYYKAAASEEPLL